MKYFKKGTENRGKLKKKKINHPGMSEPDDHYSHALIFSSRVAKRAV